LSRVALDRVFDQFAVRGRPHLLNLFVQTLDRFGGRRCAIGGARNWCAGRVRMVMGATAAGAWRV